MSATENFADLFNQSEQQIAQPGSLINAKVIYVGSDLVVLNTGLKSDATVPVQEFAGEEITVGDDTEVVVETLENGFGETRVSREKARRLHAWRDLEQAHQSGKTIAGLIAERVKGGFTVEIGAVKAFLPGSLVDVRPIRDTSFLEGKELDFKIIKMDKRRNNIVVSRRAVVESELGSERESILENLEEGKEIKGIVKNITDYGAFIDLGGVDGLLHITDMAWKRIKHPSDVLKVGDEIKVKVLKFDRDKKRVSLGMKQLGDDPWQDIARRYPINTRVFGKVTNITDYGCFVEIEDGIEGLVHMSEMDWTNKNIHPAKVVSLGDEVEVMVLEIDEDKRRISLGMKQCVQNPWDEFASKHEKGEVVHGKIRSITDFGIFIGLEGNIDGLVHLSDISWKSTPEEALRDYSKGQEVEAVILAIDPDRERISLGIKQLEDDPFSHYLEQHPKGSIVSGKVTEVDAKAATVDIGEGIQGQIRASEVSKERVKDVRQYLNVDEEVQAKVIGLDRKTSMISLSIKALIEDASSENDDSSGVTLGDIMREQMEGKE